MIAQLMIGTLLFCSSLTPTHSYDNIIKAESTLTSGVTTNIYDSLKEDTSTNLVSGVSKQITDYTTIKNISEGAVEENDVDVVEASNTENDIPDITQVIQGKIVYEVCGRNFSELTNDEYSLLCQIVAAEAGTYNSREMVAEVILNRKEITGKSIMDIVYEENQFEPVSNGALWTASVTPEIKDAVNDALQTVHHPKEMLFFRNNYYHDMATTEPYTSDGNTYFSLCYCYH